MVRPWYWPSGGQPHRTEEFTWIVKNKLAVSWWPDPPVFKRYEREGIKVIINCSEFNNERDIPHLMRSYHDTAFDGLYQAQKGWGSVSAPLTYHTEIMEIISDLRR